MSLKRIRYRPGDAGQSCFMKYKIDAFCGSRDHFGIGNVAFEELEVARDLFKIFSKTRDQIVNDSDLGSAPDQFVSEMRANKTGPAGNQDVRSECHGIKKESVQETRERIACTL